MFDIKKRSLLALLFTMLIPSIASAGITLTNISQSDYGNIVKDFSADAMFTTVSPASSLGKLWGGEIGVLAGITKTPRIQTIVRSADSTAKNVDKFPHGDIMAALTIPWGFTLEGVAFPRIKISTVNYESYGGAAKWTFSDLISEDFPIPMAFRAFYTQSRIAYTQPASTGSAVSLNVDFKDSIYGGQFLASYKLLFAEPYMGIGWTKAVGDITVAGSTTIFATSFTSSQTASDTENAFHYFAGFNLQFGFFVMGAEYERAYATNSVTGKLSARF